MNKCKDCLYFQAAEVSKEIHNLFDRPYARIDGICTKHFPRGYVARKPPHPKYSNSNACFQYEAKEVTICE